ASPTLAFALLSLRSRHRRALHSFPTRRSSDLLAQRAGAGWLTMGTRHHGQRGIVMCDLCQLVDNGLQCRQQYIVTCSLEHHAMRSEEHTSELQSRENLVCRLLLEKKNRI